MNLPAEEVRLSDRIILHTLDHQVVVRPVVAAGTRLRSGNMAACFTAYGAARWNAGEDLRDVQCFGVWMDFSLLGMADF